MSDSPFLCLPCQENVLFLCFFNDLFVLMKMYIKKLPHFFNPLYRLCFMISTYVHGADERSRVIRRTLGRYLILMQAITFQSVSTAVKKRFPTTQHLVMAGKCKYAINTFSYILLADTHFIFSFFLKSKANHFGCGGAIVKYLSKVTKLG